VDVGAIVDHRKQGWEVWELTGMGVWLLGIFESQEV